MVFVIAISPGLYFYISRLSVFNLLLPISVPVLTDYNNFSLSSTVFQIKSINVNPFVACVLILYLLETPENIWFLSGDIKCEH